MSRAGNHSAMDKDRLAAFADGELSPEDAAAVVLHLADHPADQAWVDELMAANAALARAFAGPAAEPVPERFRALIRAPGGAEGDAGLLQQGARIVPYRSRLRRILPAVAVAAMAAAAVFTGVAVLLAPGAGHRLAAGPVAAGSALEEILASRPSGQAVRFAGGELTVLSSMPAAQGFCRELELVDGKAATLALALACRDGAGWTVDVVLSETRADAGPATPGYAPASGDAATAGLAALDHWLAARGAGLALSHQDEARAIADGWRP